MFGSFFSSVWRILRTVIAVVLVCLAIYFSLGFGAAFLAGTVFSAGWAAVACLGVACLFDAELVETMASTAVDVVTDVVGAVADATGITSILKWAALGLGAYLLLTADTSSSKAVPVAK